MRAWALDGSHIPGDDKKAGSNTTFKVTNLTGTERKSYKMAYLLAVEGLVTVR